MGTVVNFNQYINDKRAADKVAAAQAAKDAKLGALVGTVVGSLMTGEPAKALEAAKEIEQIKDAENRYMPAYCDPRNEYRGSKYEATRGLSMVEVAKRIRADIKQMIQAGTLPKGIKVSVRVAHYNALRVNITALPAGFKVYKESYARATKNFTQPADRYNDYFDGVYTDEMQSVLDALDANTSSYNRDNSDIMTDYFDVRFYGGRAGIDWKFESEIRKTEAVDLNQ